MKCNLHIIKVLFKKDIKIMFTNKNFLLMMVMPLAFTLLYMGMFSGDEMDGQKYFLTTMCQVFNVLIVPLAGLSMLVAEEKEKHTLRVLMLNDVSAIEYLASKVLAVLVAMEVSGILIFVITGTEIGALLPGVFIMTLASICMLLFGGAFGMLCKDQMSTGTLTSPLFMLFMFPPLIGAYMGGIIEFLSRLIPTTSMQNLLAALFGKSSLFSSNTMIDWAVILVWTLLGTGLFLYIYRKKGFDN